MEREGVLLERYLELSAILCARDCCELIANAPLAACVDLRIASSIK